MARGNRREDIFLDDNDRAGIEGGGAGLAGSQGLAWERREEGGVGEVLREPTTVSLEWVARALCMGGAANAGHYVRTRPVEKCEEENPEGNVAVHRAES